MSKFCIGMGHGGKDSGACKGSRRECDDTLRLGLAVGNRLEYQGHEVVYTRTTDISMTPEQRRKIAVDCKCDLFIDLHRNSHTDSTAKGIEIFVSKTAHVQAAANVLDRLTAIEHQANRGVKLGAYRAINNTPMPSMLLELGFISNTRDNELFDNHFEANVEAIARGVLAALGQPYKVPQAPEERPKQYIRIQTGAFTCPDNKAGALRRLEEIRELGRKHGYPELANAFPVWPDTVKENE